MCVVLSSTVQKVRDDYLLDKSAILLSLNLKDMAFDETLGHHKGIHRLSVFDRSNFITGSDIPFLTELSMTK